ncbi:hypothetical protein [Algibacter lectus]|uniref:Uncharacterized protein n=1 Tax=Algibacter lectus TaxID=221126 RepID=A0A090VEW0_9FLAO|nr:hypothetical protein [Algibacter lectus]GAL63301.1 hypothetical protein JCM19300_1323 [Algibacter lectus]SFD53538.1 hypothetical protein SAMN04489722_111113 [Algibacter lectus]
MIETIENYCKTNDYEDFEKIGNEFVFHIDWREFDDAIVEYCESRIQTGFLSAKLNNDVLSINYDRNNFQTKITDSRDTTLKFLNKILLPKYEIRFCSITFPSDTLGFIILSSEKWGEVEKRVSKVKLDKVFEPIRENSKMFEREFKIEFDDNIKLDLE